MALGRAAIAVVRASICIIANYDGRCTAMAWRFLSSQPF